MNSEEERFLKEIRLNDDFYQKIRDFTPEEKLGIAIIARAIHDVIFFNRKTAKNNSLANNNREDTRSAKRFLADDSNDEYSFKWWCDVLQIDYEKLMVNVKKAKRKGYFLRNKKHP